ncbi:MAG: hypothetical protein IT340_09770 [Chloroflexi bacterium]|nr:hypothetical protein [Chloroflexota bacterium]
MTAHLRLVVLLVILTLIWLGLMSGQPITALADAIHDDRLFMNLAQHLSGGRWLGPFNNLTLAKGPLYPLWVALAYTTGVPLLLSQHLLVVASGLAAVWAVRPAVPSAAALALVYGVLLFNPVLFSGTRVVREAIYPALTLLACAAAIGVWLRRDGTPRALAAWSVLAGLALGVVWVTREEGVWLLPAIGLLLGGTVVQIWRRGVDRWRRLLLVASAPVLAVAVVVLVAAINLGVYGVFAVTEFTTAEWLAAYGAVTRVEPATRRPYVPLAREDRQRLYQVSPAFAELRRTLEGPSLAAWEGHSCQAVPSACGEVAGGWFMWALRDAVAGAGHYRSAPAALAYYRRLADEVNAACDAGSLRCGPRRDSMAPVWHGEGGPRLLESLARATIYLVTFDGLPVAAGPSTGDEAGQQVFRRITRERLAPTQGASPVAIDGRDQLLLAGLVAVRDQYRQVAPALAGLALGGLAVAGVAAGRGRPSALALPILALLVAVASRVALIALIDAAAFAAVTAAYLGPAYGLLLLAGLLGGVALVTAARLAWHAGFCHTGAD